MSNIMPGMSNIMPGMGDEQHSQEPQPQALIAATHPRMQVPPPPRADCGPDPPLCPSFHRCVRLRLGGTRLSPASALTLTAILLLLAGVLRGGCNSIECCDSRESSWTGVSDSRGSRGQGAQGRRGALYLCCLLARGGGGSPRCTLTLHCAQFTAPHPADDSPPPCPLRKFG